MKRTTLLIYANAAVLALVCMVANTPYAWGAEPQEEQGRTPLHLAILEGGGDKVAALLAAGANAKIKSNARKTAYALAKQQGHKKVASLIKKAAKSR